MQGKNHQKLNEWSLRVIRNEFVYSFKGNKETTAYRTIKQYCVLETFHLKLDDTEVAARNRPFCHSILSVCSARKCCFVRRAAES